MDSLSQIAGIDPHETVACPVTRRKNKAKLELATSCFKKHYQQNIITPLDILSGVVQALDALRSQQVEMFVISNHLDDLLKHDIEKAGLARYFQHIIGTKAPEEYKPGIEMFRALSNTLPKLNKKRDKIYYVGDQLSDIEAAKTAQCSSILVSNKPFTKMDLIPDYWIEAISMLPSLVLPEKKHTARGM